MSTAPATASRVPCHVPMPLYMLATRLESPPTLHTLDTAHTIIDTPQKRRSSVTLERSGSALSPHNVGFHTTTKSHIRGDTCMYQPSNGSILSGLYDTSTANAVEPMTGGTGGGDRSNASATKCWLAERTCVSSAFKCRSSVQGKAPKTVGESDAGERSPVAIHIPQANTPSAARPTGQTRRGPRCAACAFDPHIPPNCLHCQVNSSLVARNSLICCSCFGQRGRT